MSSRPSDSASDGVGRLERCIRDLAALHALPSLCIGTSPDEALAIVLDALPTALSCELAYLSVPGLPPRERASYAGKTLDEAGLSVLRAALAADEDADASGARRLDLGPFGQLWCAEAEVPVGSARGRLVVARATPLDRDTDRVLVRSAANLVGTTLEAAIVLEAAGRKDDFLAMLGHELRGPLAPIATAVELLERHPSAVREREVIQRHTRHLARLVDDLLDISRVTHGDVELKAEPVSLASALERAVEMATPLIGRQRQVLRVALGEPSMVQGDPVRLAQIFGNLLTNAAKFTPAGGHIDLVVEPLPDRVRVTVRDDGRGIAADQLRRIFEPFVQAGRRGDALRGGLGLGLAIAHNLVERHGGTIDVESEGLGRGATFTVELPRIAYVARTEVTPPAAPVVARACVRVLVVDDNVDLAELLSEALTVEGFQTAVAHDAHGALAQWREFEPHAAVLDVGMPELDGYELARLLRAEHGGQATLIAATGYGQASDRSRSAEAGFDFHFVKPVSVRELVGALDERVTRAGTAARPATA
jgi:signal transduction histidine kinase/ActR/RegA family two-component response regulator